LVIHLLVNELKLLEKGLEILWSEGSGQGYVLVKRSASNMKDSWLVIPERKKAID
jgi:hypothetical protein